MTMLARLLAMLLLVAGLGLVASGQAAAAGRPSAPRAVAAAPGNGTATLTWKAPARRGGSKVRAYGVQRRSGATWSTVATVSGRKLSWQAAGLSNGQPSDYRVRARNGSGWGRPSAAVRVTPRTVPGVPALTEADGYGSALGVYWRAPASNGAPIDYYRVEISTDGVTWTDPRDTTVAATSAQPFMVTGLAPGSRYRVRVRAHNAQGFGDDGQAGPYRVYAGSGPVLTPTATPGDGKVDLSWSAPAVPPASEGLLAAAQYLVEASADGGATWAVVGQPTTTSYVATGLANGTTYRFRISARPSARYPYGPATVVLADAPSGPPYVLGVAPASVAVAEGATETFEVSLGLPAVADVVVALGSSDPSVTVDPTVTVPAGQGTVQVTVTGAVDDDAVDGSATVTATLGDQHGTVTVTVDDTTPPPGPVTLDAPVLTRTSPASYTVGLGWTAPAAGLVTDYLVQRSTDGGEFTDLGTTAALTYDDTTAVPLTSYTYRVVARGPAGASTPADLPVTTGTPYDLSVSTSSLQVAEGASTTFTVELDPAAADDVVVTVTSSDTSAVTVDSPAPPVTIPQGESSVQVQVSGVQDVDLVNASATVTVTLGSQQRTVSVTVVDDDAQALVVTRDAADVTEVVLADGESTLIDVRLAHQPSANVTVMISSDAPSKASVTPSTLIFTPGNWNQPQQFTISHSSPASATVSVGSTGLATHTISVTAAP